MDAREEEENQATVGPFMQAGIQHTGLYPIDSSDTRLDWRQLVLETTTVLKDAVFELHPPRG